MAKCCTCAPKCSTCSHAHERGNGRLYSEVQFALPRELDAAGRRELAGAFAAQVCGGERLPYTLALHRGGPDGENPHAHLMFSERGNDGIARSEEQWFKRHNPTAPAQGGARKSRAAKAGDWLASTRQTWEQTANRALEQAGREARIDHRIGSYIEHTTQADPVSMTRLRKGLDEFLERDQDRAVFDLPPRPKDA